MQLLLAGCVLLGKPANSWGLRFLICEMGVLVSVSRFVRGPRRQAGSVGCEGDRYFRYMPCDPSMQRASPHISESLARYRGP